MVTTKKLATLNFQIDYETYEKLKNISHQERVSLASMFREFSQNIVKNYTKNKKQLITLEPSFPITELSTALPNDYNPIPISDDNEIPAFRLPSSIKFQNKTS